MEADVPSETLVSEVLLLVIFQKYVNWNKHCVTSGFHREVDENCALLCHYAASSGNSLPTFRDNLSVPSSRLENRRSW